MKSKNKILIFPILIILLCSLVLGANTFSNTYDNQLSNNAGNPFTFNTDISSINDFVSGNGYDGKPKICDIDSDNIKEFVSFDYNGSKIYYIDGAGNSLSIPSEINAPSGYGIIDLICTSSNDVIIISLILQSATGIKIADYTTDGVTLTENYVYKEKNGFDYVPYSEITCTEWTLGGTIDARRCVYAPQPSYGVSLISFGLYDAFALRRFEEITIDDGTLYTVTSTVNQTIGTQVPTSKVSVKQNVVLDRFGGDVYFIDNLNKSVIHASFSDCVLGSETCDISSFDTATIFAGFQGKLNRVDYDGFDYICFDSVSYTGNAIISVECFSGDLATKISKTVPFIGIGTLNGAYFSDSLSVDLNGDGYEEYCHSKYGDFTTGDAVYSGCFDLKNNDDTSFRWNYNMGAPQTAEIYNIGGVFYVNNVPTLVVYNSTATDYISLSYPSGTLDVSLLSGGFTAINGYSKVDDIGGDGVGELIFTNSAGVYVGFTIGQLPSTITIVGSATNPIFGYYSTSCNDTSVTFTAKECVDTLTCSYTSSSTDSSEKERLCSTCGGTSVYSCGTWSLATPTITCNNLTSSVGDKSVSFEMFTDKNPSIIAKTFDVDLTVATTSCDQQVDLVLPPVIGGIDPETGEGVDGETPDGIDDGKVGNAVARFWDTITFQSEFIQVIIGILLVIAVISGTAKAGFKDPFGLTIVALLGVVMVTFMGLFPVMALVLLGLLLVLMLLVYGILVKR